MSLKHAILVLLDAEPGSGSDLVQRFRSGIGHFWNATHQQVYQELKALLAEDRVEFEVEAQETRPEKKVYRITRGGRRELRSWMGEPTKPPRVRDALLVKVFGTASDPAVMVAELDRRHALHAKQLEAYLELEQHWFAQTEAIRRQYRNPYLTLRRGIRYEREMLDWLEETKLLLQEDALPQRPALAGTGGKERKH
ncbi:MAG TPA: PadR family transcriptional regulator [Solimonas sp.]|nr:PadR family transcriptional regulator [Solimonas sp.]